MLGTDGETTRDSMDSIDLSHLVDEAPVVRLVNLLLSEALTARASDVHLEAGAAGMEVRYRVDGVLRRAPAPPVNLAPAVVGRLKLMAELDVAERRRPQDGRTRLRVEGRCKYAINASRRERRTAIAGSGRPTPRAREPRHGSRRSKSLRIPCPTSTRRGARHRAYRTEAVRLAKRESVPGAANPTACSSKSAQYTDFNPRTSTRRPDCTKALHRNPMQGLHL